MSATKRAVSRFGNGAGLCNEITNMRAQRVPQLLTPPSRRAVPQGKALETKNHRLSQASGNLKLQNLKDDLRHLARLYDVGETVSNTVSRDVALDK